MTSYYYHTNTAEHAVVITYNMHIIIIVIIIHFETVGRN